MYQSLLPVKIEFGSTTSIQFLYNSNGKRVKKSVSQGSTVNFTEYLDGFNYTNNELDFFTTSEGSVEVSNPGTGYVFDYIYNYLDHLGNVRIRFGIDQATNQIAILEENNYYPFGLRHQNYNMSQRSYQRLGHTLQPCSNCPDTYSYKYNGKEWQDELGLNLYDYGARNYDPAIGRWVNIDPLAEKFESWSPYNYALDNPVYFIDPDGQSATNTYNIDVSTGKTTLVDRKGGDKTDYVNIVGSNGQILSSTVENVTTTRVTNTFSSGILPESFTMRGPGYKTTVDFKRADGSSEALKDPSAEMFMAWAGGKIIGTALGAAYRGISALVAEDVAVTAEGSAVAAETAASTPIGSLSQPLNVVTSGKNVASNLPATIEGVEYSGHALDKMQRSGIMPTVVKDVIQNGTRAAGNRAGTTTSTLNGVKAVTNSNGRVITVMAKTH